MQDQLLSRSDNPQDTIDELLGNFSKRRVATLCDRGSLAAVCSFEVEVTFNPPALQQQASAVLVGEKLFLLLIHVLLRMQATAPSAASEPGWMECM